MAENMKVKYDKYCRNFQNINILIFVVVVFDPQTMFQFVCLVGLKQNL